jgi:hypothetical protein
MALVEFMKSAWRTRDFYRRECVFRFSFSSSRVIGANPINFAI